MGVEFGDQGLGFSVWVLRLGFKGTTLVYSIYTSSCGIRRLRLWRVFSINCGFRVLVFYWF